jgi:signal transduction histidine kinase
MTRLIDQLLSLARADAGVEVLRLEPVNLPDLIEEVAEEWAERFAEAQIQFSYELDTPELWIEADYVAFKRLLNILLENAWRYTPSGQSVTLAVRTQVQGLDHSAAEISVTDTGLGISAENQSRIFQRFCRIAQPLHGHFTGSGLGLVLAQWIAERHGSAIQLQSAQGNGSRFSLLLSNLPADQKPTGHPSIQTDEALHVLPTK